MPRRHIPTYESRLGDIIEDTRGSISRGVKLTPLGVYTDRKTLYLCNYYFTVKNMERFASVQYGVSIILTLKFSEAYTFLRII